MAEKLERYVHPLSLTDVKEKLMCNNPFCGGGITAIICDSKGDLYPCGCANMTTQWLLGNVDTLDEQAFLDRIYKFHEKGSKYYEECRLCNASCICNFGCPGFRTIDGRTDETECHATKMFYSFLREKDQRIVVDIVQSLRLGKQEHAWRYRDTETETSIEH
jgi:radical SAM protein with 4Fe4S-binding SPASM domain